MGNITNFSLVSKMKVYRDTKFQKKKEKRITLFNQL